MEAISKASKNRMEDISQQALGYYIRVHCICFFDGRQRGGIMLSHRQKKYVCVCMRVHVCVFKQEADFLVPPGELTVLSLSQT